MRRASLKQELERVRRLCDSGELEQAFAAIEKVVKRWPGNSHALVMWADVLQLQAEDTGPPLKEAKRALEEAVDLEEHAPMPLIELGHYFFALDDDAKRACACFDKAIAVSKHLLKEALLGKAKTLSELDRRPEVLGCLAEAYWLQSHNGTKEKNGNDILAQLDELSQKT